MTRAMKELRELAAADIPKQIQDLRKEYAKLQAQVSTGTPPKNTMQLRNIRKTVSRMLTITSAQNIQKEHAQKPTQQKMPAKEHPQQKIKLQQVPKKRSKEVNPKA